MKKYLPIVKGIVLYTLLTGATILMSFLKVRLRVPDDTSNEPKCV